MEKRFSSEDIDRAKKTNLREYLGIGQRNILSPFRDENVPSFSIFRHSSGNWIGKDHGDDKIYDAIAIVQKIENKSFVEAVKSLLSFAESQEKGQKTIAIAEDIPDYALAQNNSPEWLQTGLQKAPGKEKNHIKYEWQDNNVAGLDYLIHERKINFEVVEKIADKIKLVDVVIEKNDRTYRNRMIAFPNIAGGWHCRNINPNSPVREHIIAPSGLTIAGNQNSSNVYIFESCIDMLSYISLNPAVSGAKLVSLNSVNNYKKLSDLQLQNKTIYMCLDNDDAGWATVKKIKEMLNGYDNDELRRVRQLEGPFSDYEKEMFAGRAYVDTDIMRHTEMFRRKDINEMSCMSESDIKNELLAGFDPNDRQHHRILGRTQKIIFDRLFPALPEPRICTIEMRKEMSTVHDILNPSPVIENNNTAYRKYTPAPGDPF
jgi:hypothetical protein